MDPQFQRLAVIITVVGLAILVAGAFLLLLAFRAFGSAKRGDVKHMVLFVSAIAFILLCCAGLLVWSSLQRG